MAQMIQTKYGKAIVMSFVDAEHSGMNLDDLAFECDVSGIDLKKENPIALIIQFDGGFVNPTKKDEKAIIRFKNFIDHNKEE